MEKLTDWHLLAPDWEELDSVWCNSLPFVLWPVGYQPLLGHWMDAAVRAGVERVTIYVADRPNEVKTWLKNVAFWSLEVTVVTVGNDFEMPRGFAALTGLPEDAALESPPSSGIELLHHWFALQKHWLAGRLEDVPVLDIFHQGGWLGPGADIHPTAELVPPFWIGNGAKVGPCCRVGPNGFVGRNAVLDSDVCVEDAWVDADTYVGRHLSLIGGFVSGNLLLDMRRGVRLELKESWLICSFRRSPLWMKVLMILMWGFFLATVVFWKLCAPYVSWWL